MLSTDVPLGTFSGGANVSNGFLANAITARAAATTAPLIINVSDVTGFDGNDGLTPATAVNGAQRATLATVP